MFTKVHHVTYVVESIQQMADYLGGLSRVIIPAAYRRPDPAPQTAPTAAAVTERSAAIPLESRCDSSSASRDDCRDAGVGRQWRRRSGL